MKVFLAGKVDPVDGAWRDALLGHDFTQGQVVARWQLTRPPPPVGWSLPEPPPPPWPRTPNTWVLRQHEYVGPYAVQLRPAPDASNTGVFHGTQWRGAHGEMVDVRDEQHVVGECQAAIRRADLVFAYLNTWDCYGTLVELGYARALGKFVALAIAPWLVAWDPPDDTPAAPVDPRAFWFAAAVASHRCLVPWEGPDAASEAAQIQVAFRDALVAWAAAPPRWNALERAVGGLAAIAHWTSDPRARAEAERVLRLFADQDSP